MAVTSAKIRSEKISKKDGAWTGTRAYQVECDAITDDVVTAYGAAPAVGSGWSAILPTLKVIGLDAEHDNDDQLTYTVTVNYSSKAEDAQSTIEDPLSRPAQFAYGDQTISAPYFRDAEDEPVVNSAGDGFTDLPQRETSSGTITITRNVASFDDARAESYRNTINTSGVSLNGVIYAARTLRITGWSAQGPKTENNVTFWQETITIAKKADAWDDKFEDRGLNELDGSNKLKPILDARHEPVASPWPLDGSGGAKASATDAPERLTFKPYEPSDFTTL